MESTIKRAPWSDVLNAKYYDQYYGLSAESFAKEVGASSGYIRMIAREAKQPGSDMVRSLLDILAVNWSLRQEDGGRWFAEAVFPHDVSSKYVWSFGSEDHFHTQQAILHQLTRIANALEKILVTQSD